eukprot:s1108_g15.t1
MLSLARGKLPHHHPSPHFWPIHLRRGKRSTPVPPASSQRSLRAGGAGSGWPRGRSISRRIAMGCGASAGRFEEFSSFHAQYSLGSTPKALGKGSYGSVFLATARHAKHSSFAVKVQTARRTATKKIEHEAAKIWKLCASHRNVVHFVQMCQEADIYFMVMEACQCSLFDRLIDNPKWVWDQLSGDLHQLVSGLQHLHSRRVLHSDIKAENALYGGPDGKILKLADFGLAVYITPSEGPLTRARGSRSYMAPEMLAGEGYAFPADMWSFGVLVYVILVGQFPIGQSRQTKSELTRNIIKVEKEPARVTNLANKLKRAIAVEQGKLDRRPYPSVSDSHRSSSEFHRILPSSEGSMAQEEVITRHVGIQMKRLKVVDFIRLFLQRDPSDRCTANEAIQSELFQELQYMRQEHRATEHESQLLIINRRPLKRTEQTPAEPLQKPDDKADDVLKDDDDPRRGPTAAGGTGVPGAVSGTAQTPLVTTAKSAPASPRSPAPPSGDGPPAVPLKRRSQTSGRLEDIAAGDEGRDKLEPLRRRSLTSHSFAENSQGMSLLQVPQRRRKSASSAKDLNDSAQPSRSQSDFQSQMLLEAHEKDLRPSSEGHQEPQTVSESSPHGAKSSASNAATTAAANAAANAATLAAAVDAEPEDGAPAELERGQMTKSFSRMSSRGSRLGARSMLSRDNSGFDLLHNLANTNIRGDSSWQLEQSGFDASTLRQSRSRGALSSAASLRSGLSGVSGRGQEEDVLSPLHPKPPDPWRGDSAPISNTTNQRSSGISTVNQDPDEEGPRPSALQRRVSLGDMGSESPNPKNLRRRVSFDEVLVMQHMLPSVPNQVPKEKDEEDSD